MSPLSLLLAAAATVARAASPRGINTYDSLSMADTNETSVLTAACFMAEYLLPYGYDTLVIDGGWYDGVGPEDISLDAFGRPLPWPQRFPRGFKALAADVHALGLKLGAWLMRGVPVKAAAGRWPIAGSDLTADAAVRLDRNCSWSGENLGTDAPSPAAAAYLASVAALWVEWGLDFVKVDCMFGPGRPSDPIYHEDVVAFSQAMAAVGVPVSLSPGSWVSPANGSVIAAGRYAVAYRVTQDFWDRWTDRIAVGEYPSGVRSKLDVAVAYVRAGLIGLNDTYPDLDMLPLGTTLHNDRDDGNVYGPASPTHLTRPEQLTIMTLWCAMRAPLFFGGRVPLDADDAWTLALITNAEVLAVHNESDGTRVVNVSSDAAAHYAFAADATGGRAGFTYLALFNAADAGGSVAVPMASLGLPPGTAAFCARDLWARAPLPGSWSIDDVFSAAIDGHGAAFYSLAPC